MLAVSHARRTRRKRQRDTSKVDKFLNELKARTEESNVTSQKEKRTMKFKNEKNVVINKKCTSVVCSEVEEEDLWKSMPDVTTLDEEIYVHANSNLSQRKKKNSKKKCSTQKVRIYYIQCKNCYFKNN